MFNLVSRIGLYYDSIDAGNIEKALEVFAPNAIYMRGNRRLDGNLDAFYKNERNIAHSNHKIEKIAVSHNVVSTIGGFEGTTKNGLPIKTRFKDVFIFANDLVVYRLTEFYGEDI